MTLPGKLVCITGIDGSGKSTASKRVAERLQDMEVRAEYVWGRYRPFLLYPLYIAARWFISRNQETESYSGYSTSKYEYTSSHPWLSRVYMALLLLDYWFQVQLKVTLPMFMGKTVVSDRYVFDTIIVDVANELHLDEKQVEDLIRHYFMFVPKPRLTFVLDVPNGVALDRKDDIPGESYLTHRRSFYHHLSGSFPVIDLDGTASKRDIEDRIVRELVENMMVDDCMLSG